MGTRATRTAAPANQGEWGKARRAFAGTLLLLPQSFASLRHTHTFSLLQRLLVSPPLLESPKPGATRATCCCEISLHEAVRSAFWRCARKVPTTLPPGLRAHSDLLEYPQPWSILVSLSLRQVWGSRASSAQTALGTPKKFLDPSTTWFLREKQEEAIHSTLGPSTGDFSQVHV